jgi:DNA recombination protein RmuC
MQKAVTVWYNVLEKPDEWGTEMIYLIIGLGIGILIAYFFLRPQRKDTEIIAQELMERFRQEKSRDLESFMDRVKGSFSILSQEALGRSIDEFLKLARQTLGTQTKEGEKELESKKRLIDQNLGTMSNELEKVRNMLKGFEKERSEQYGSLANQLKAAGEITSRLQETTNELTTALSSSKQRGQWGEKMAEDVLRIAGFIEGIQYRKQTQLEGGRSRPDFTFFLPQNLLVNMDVKFPLDNYMKHLSAETNHERDTFKKEFLRDVANRIKEVTGREYINPEENTVDYVLVFIPNEQVYSFIWENDSTIIDRAMEKKVLLCSPVTLLAILGIIHQAVENFNLKKTTSDIIGLLSNFLKQWHKFVEGMEKMGRKIEEAEKEYEKLVTTRRTSLERPLKKIDELRRQRRKEAAVLPSEEPPSLEKPDLPIQGEND